MLLQTDKIYISAVKRFSKLIPAGATIEIHDDRSPPSLGRLIVAHVVNPKWEKYYSFYVRSYIDPFDDKAARGVVKLLGEQIARHKWPSNAAHRVRGEGDGR